MTEAEARDELVRSLRERVAEAVATARNDRLLSPSAAISRAYYAAFYAASAVMAAEGRHFVRHAGLRASLHRDLVKPGRLSVECGRLFDELSKARQTADYLATVHQTTEEADAAIAAAEKVSDALISLLPNQPG